MTVKVILKGENRYSTVEANGEYVGCLWNAENKGVGKWTARSVITNKRNDFFIHADEVVEEEEQEITELEPEEQLEEMEGDNDKLSKEQWERVRRY